MITQVSDPVWNPNNRLWEIVYTVNDSNIGFYLQRITCETLVAAERIIKQIKETIKCQKTQNK